MASEIKRVNKMEGLVSRYKWPPAIRKSLRYLRIRISNRMMFNPHINNQIAMAKQRMRQCNGLFRSKEVLESTETHGVDILNMLMMCSYIKVQT